MAFDAINVNEEEMIDINDFANELSSNFNIEDSEKIEILFNMFDLDKDGFISKKDWELMFEQCPMKLINEEKSSFS